MCSKGIDELYDASLDAYVDTARAQDQSSCRWHGHGSSTWQDGEQIRQGQYQVMKKLNYYKAILATIAPVASNDDDI